MSVKIKLLIPLLFLLCCVDFRLMNRRYEHEKIEAWQDEIQHLYCSSTLSMVKKKLEC